MAEGSEGHKEGTGMIGLPSPHEKQKHIGVPENDPLEGRSVFLENSNRELRRRLESNLREKNAKTSPDSSHQ